MARSLRFKRIQRTESLTDSVYEAIKEAILTIKIGPGEKLNVAEIAHDLGTSSTPVREALNRLINEGLVTNVPFKGLFVSEVTPEGVQQLLEFRSLVELEAIRKAAEHFSAKDAQVGRSLINKMRKAYQKGDIHTYIETSLDFHRLFISNCGNQMMTDFLEDLTDKIKRLAFLAVAKRDQIPAFIEDYERMLKALEIRDSAQAKKALREHLKRVEDSLYSGTS